MNCCAECFRFGALAALGLALVITALFGWAFITVTEGHWTKGWRR